MRHCHTLLLVAASCFTCHAQPSMSRGQQSLTIRSDECLRRAALALRAEGYSSGGSGNFAQGFKGEHGAYIICNDLSNGTTVVNIVVASLAGDAGVPGYERQRLQAQMERPGTTGAGPAIGSACGLGALWKESEEGWTGVWTRRGTSNVFDVRSSKPGMQPLTALQTIDISGNRVSVKRTSSSDGNTCDLEGTIAQDGIHVSGSYRCRSGGPYSWSAEIQCDRP